MIWTPAGASSRELSDRQGVSTGGAMSSAPPATRAWVVPAASATSNATRNFRSHRTPHLDAVDERLLGRIRQLEGRSTGVQDRDVGTVIAVE